VQLPNNHCRNIKVNGEFKGSFKVQCDTTSGNTIQLKFPEIDCKGSSTRKILQIRTCIDDGVLSEQPHMVGDCNIASAEDSF
jgi:hypothetical protein